MSHPVAAIIKLGGAAITNKHDYESLRPDVLRKAAKSIQQLHRRVGATAGLCIVHGAGSFGHIDAHKYAVATGGGGDRQAAVEGFIRTRRSVTKLNHLVVSALVDEGVPAVGLSPCGAWATSDRQLRDCTPGIASVAALLEAGFVPVLHGDCVLDDRLGVTILSGDTIMRQLAESFMQPACRPYAVFLTNVPGVFTKPPEQPGAELLRLVEVAQDGSWRAATITTAAAEAAAEAAAVPADSSQQSASTVHFSAAEHDTTGGMATKIAEAAGVVAERGCPVVIAEAGSLSGAAAVLLGPDAFTDTPSSVPPDMLQLLQAMADVSDTDTQLRATVLRLVSAADSR